MQIKRNKQKKRKPKLLKLAKLKFSKLTNPKIVTAPPIKGEALPSEARKKVSRKSFYLAILTFFMSVLTGNYLINLIHQTIQADFNFNFFNPDQTSKAVWFKWSWLINAKTPTLFLINIIIASVLATIFYKQLSKRLETLANGQKGDHRFKTLAEIKAQFVEIPDRKATYAGIGGVLISHYKNSYFIDLDTVNSLFLGTSRSGKGEGHVIPLIDILSRATMNFTSRFLAQVNKISKIKNS